MTQSVFVTGGSGYLGAPLLRALAEEGYTVVAMARSAEAGERVAAAGARPVRCDLTNVERLTEALQGCELVVHAAARFQEGGGYAAYHRDNVEGTRNLLGAARAAGVRRLVYVGAAGCLVGGRPLVDADESWPMMEPTWSPYFRTKTIADREVLASSTDNFTTCVVRPGLIWGGDPSPILDGIAEATRAGKMMLINGGRHRIVTSHLDNTVRAIVLALARGRAGQAYFVFDDGTTELRAFFAALLATRNLPPPDKAIPYPVALTVASILEVAWKVLRRPGAPPITRELVKLTGRTFVISDRRARNELGYVPVVTREEGIAQLGLTAEPAPARGLSAPPR